MSMGRGPFGPLAARARPGARSMACAAARSSRGDRRVAPATTMLRKRGWEVLYKGAVSYTEETRSCRRCRPSLPTASASKARRSPRLEPRDRKTCWWAIECPEHCGRRPSGGAGGGAFGLGGLGLLGLFGLLGVLGILGLAGRLVLLTGGEK